MGAPILRPPDRSGQCAFPRLVLALAAGTLAACNGGETTGPPQPTRGSVEVSTSTNGPSVDPDGYTASIGSDTETIPTNGSVTFTGVPEGSASVELEGIAFNCDLDVDNPLSVTVTAGETANAAFSVSCPKPRIAFGSNRQGDQFDVYVMNSDGTEVGNLTPDNLTTDAVPDFSPDGRRIVFQRSTGTGDGGVFVMDEDGSDATPLTSLDGSSRCRDGLPTVR